MFIRIAVIFFGVGFLIPGLLGVFLAGAAGAGLPEDFSAFGAGFAAGFFGGCSFASVPTP